MQELHLLINNCIKGDRQSQASLYKHYAPTMMVVCMRYSKNKEEAEEALQEGFMKVFTHLQQFKFEGSFEGWIRRIMVNCSLRRLKSKHHLHAVVNIDNSSNLFEANETIHASLGAKELLLLVQQLPPAYKMVFNLYVFEGLKHREIAELLDISEGTSKSNLSDARVILQKAVLQHEQTINLNAL